VSEQLDGAFDLFVEVPLEAPEPLIAELAVLELSAKIRTGGVTADAFPSAGQIGGFMRACVAADVPFKATAGLHHPLTGTHRLTYEDGAAQARMFGFLNVFVAAGLAGLGAEHEAVRQVLVESDPRAFEFREGALCWREVQIDTAGLASLRRRVALSFGSCSFTEPVEDLVQLGVLE
jgi:hypothetical protein